MSGTPTFSTSNKDFTERIRVFTPPLSEYGEDVSCSLSTDAAWGQTLDIQCPQEFVGLYNEITSEATINASFADILGIVYKAQSARVRLLRRLDHLEKSDGSYLVHIKGWKSVDVLRDTFPEVFEGVDTTDRQLFVSMSLKLVFALTGQGEDEFGYDDDDCYIDVSLTREKLDSFVTIALYNSCTFVPNDVPNDVDGNYPSIRFDS